MSSSAPMANEPRNTADLRQSPRGVESRATKDRGDAMRRTFDSFSTADIKQDPGGPIRSHGEDEDIESPSHRD